MKGTTKQLDMTIGFRLAPPPARPAQDPATVAGGPDTAADGREPWPVSPRAVLAISAAMGTSLTAGRASGVAGGHVLTWPAYTGPAKRH